MIEVTWRDGNKDYIKVEDCPNCDYWHFKSKAYMDVSEKWRLNFYVAFALNIALIIAIIVILCNK